jgi:hypothetical protein
MPPIFASSNTATIASSVAASMSGASFAAIAGRFSPRFAARIAQARRIEKHLTVGRIRTRDVEREVVDDRREAFGEQHEVVGRIGALRVARDIHAEHPARLTAAQATRDDVGTRIREAHLVDDGPLGGIAEHAWPRITRLRQRRHAADLDE